jgi:hypothetical protein
MAGFNYKKAIQLHEQRGAHQAGADLAELFKAKEIRPRDIDLGRLFVECFGWQNYVACRARETLVHNVMEQALTEDAGAVSTAAFLNISGQFVYTTVMDAYENEESVFTALIPEAPASTLDGEKIPGITQIGDEIAFRNEGDPYALAGVGEDWVFTPPVRDRGVEIAATWEAFFNDKTGQLADRCGDVGKWGKIHREKAAIDCFVDENVTTHRYNWRGTVIASYGENTGTHTWDNLAATNGALVDWVDLDAIEQVFNAMEDPYTAEPILFDPKYLVVTKSNEQIARRILSATEIRSGDITSGAGTQMLTNNLYSNKYQLVTSRLLASRMTTDTDYFLADIGKYAKCMIAEKAQVVQAPANSYEEFHRRIVQQWRFNERFAYVVVQPRASVKATVS